jgi:hypothetical protein
MIIFGRFSGWIDALMGDLLGACGRFAAAVHAGCKALAGSVPGNDQGKAGA